jgi:ABC-type multidrug transport system fused ATPase/permease subunit
MTGDSALSGLSALVIGVAGVLVMVVGAHSIRDGQMSLGDLFAFTFYVALVAAPVAQIAQIGTQISEAFAGLDRIREVRRLATERDEDAGREPLGELAGAIRFEGVSFAYEGDRDVLRGVTLDAAPGTTTALVGPSGSGKSTLIALVMGFHRPRAGRVLVDGRPLDGVRLSDYRARLGVVLQDNFLFDGTVAENIAFARPGATRAEVEAAARLANCDDFVAGFADGYDTIVGERGVKLSGGQRQRVAIARALLADPRVLILDEATSSLDSESEARIQEALARLRRGRTTFVIAHRLSTIVAADQILVLDQGEIVERGSHGELLAHGGLYRRLYERQHRGETDRFLNPGEAGAVD